MILPVASPFEREGLRFGFDISLEAQSLVQLRPAVIEPLGETRPEFGYRVRLGRTPWPG